MAGKGSVKLSIYSTFDDGGTKKAERALASFTKKFGEVDINTGKMKLDAVTESLVLQSIQADQSAQKWAKVSDGLSQAGATMTMFATVPIVAAGAASVKLATDFESSMSRVAGALDDPAANMQELSDLALQMGADTIFSASESGAAMEELAKGGLTAADIKGGALATTMDLAAAGNLELADSANTVVQAMGAFELSAEDTSQAANALAGSAAASSADVADLTQGLSQVAAQAHSAGWSIQDTTAVLGAFADAGVTGSDAGTSLKTMLQRLAAPTDKAADAIDALGINVRDGNGNMLDAAGVAEELQNKLGGLSSAEKDAAMQTIFGADASRAALIMTNQGRDGIEKYTAATNDQTAAQRLADSQMGDSERAMEEMNGAIESASIKIGQELIPMVTEGANVVGDAADAFSGLDDETQKTIVQIVAATAAIGPLLSIGGKMAGMVSGAYGAYAKFTSHLAKFSAGSGAAAKAAGLLNTSVKLLGAGVATFAVVTAVNELSKLAYGLTDAHQAAVKSVDTLGSVGDGMTSFGERMAAAGSIVSDMSATVTASGSTVGEVSGVIAEKEAAITEIINTALSEQRELREEDLQSIRDYNTEIEQLESEKVQAYQSGMQGLADAAAQEGTITADRAAELLATTDDYYSSAKKSIDEYYSARTQKLNEQYTIEKTITTEEYKSGIAAANNYRDQAIDNLEKTASSTKNVISQHADTTVQISQDTLTSLAESREKFGGLMRAGVGDFGVYLNSDVRSVEEATQKMSDALASLATDGNSSFLALQATMATSGGEITAENAVMIDTLLSQFDDLPPELGDAGDKAMRALAEGLDDELGIDVANSTADQIIEAYRSKVGVAEGVGGDTSSAYASGFSAHTQEVLDAASAIVGISADELAKSAEQAGVKGDEAVAAYAFALANGATSSEAAALANSSAASVGLTTDGATPGSAGGTEFAYALGGTFGLSQEQAALVAQSGVTGLGSVDTTPSGIAFGGQYTFGIGQTDAYGPGNSLANSANDGASSVDGSSAGSWFAQGFVGEIGNWIKSAWDAGAALVNAALGGGNSAQQTGSPAKKTKEMMKWFALGYIDDEPKYESGAYSAGYSLATASLSGTNDALSNVNTMSYNVPTRAVVTSQLSSANSTASTPDAIAREVAKAVSGSLRNAPSSQHISKIDMYDAMLAALSTAKLEAVLNVSDRELAKAIESPVSLLIGKKEQRRLNGL